MPVVLHLDPQGMLGEACAHDDPDVAPLQAVDDAVLHQGLEDEYRDQAVHRLGVDFFVVADHVGEADALDLEVFADEGEFLLQRDELRADAERAAEQGAEPQHHGPGHQRVDDAGRTDRVEHVEDEVRVDLRLQRTHLRLGGHLSLHLDLVELQLGGEEARQTLGEGAILFADGVAHRAVELHRPGGLTRYHQRGDHSAGEATAGVGAADVLGTMGHGHVHVPKGGSGGLRGDEVAPEVVLGFGSLERQDALGVGDSDRVEVELATEHSHQIAGGCRPEAGLQDRQRAFHDGEYGAGSLVVRIARDGHGRPRVRRAGGQGEDGRDQNGQSHRDDHEGA